MMPVWGARAGYALAQLDGEGAGKGLLQIVVFLLSLVFLPLFLLPTLVAHIPLMSDNDLGAVFAAAEEAGSRAGVEIPWKEVAAVWAARGTEGSPASLASLVSYWLERHEETAQNDDGTTDTRVWYTLRSLGEVEDLLGLTDAEKEQAGRYLATLCTGGFLLPELWQPEPAPGWAWPLPGHTRVSSPYGPRINPLTGRPEIHPGVDLPAPSGTPVLAAVGGEVETGSDPGGYGNYVVVRYGPFETRYAHLSAVLVDDGQRVAAGDIVGRVGSTGLSTGPHLHFEIRFDGRALDPLQYF